MEGDVQPVAFELALVRRIPGEVEQGGGQDQLGIPEELSRTRRCPRPRREKFAPKLFKVRLLAALHRRFGLSKRRLAASRRAASAAPSARLRSAAAARAQASPTSARWRASLISARRAIWVASARARAASALASARARAACASASRAASASLARLRLGDPRGLRFASCIARAASALASA